MNLVGTVTVNLKQLR